MAGKGELVRNMIEIDLGPELGTWEVPYTFELAQSMQKRYGGEGAVAEAFRENRFGLAATVELVVLMVNTTNPTATLELRQVFDPVLAQGWGVLSKRIITYLLGAFEGPQSENTKKNHVEDPDSEKPPAS